MCENESKVWQTNVVCYENKINDHYISYKFKYLNTIYLIQFAFPIASM